MSLYKTSTNRSNRLLFKLTFLLSSKDGIVTWGLPQSSRRHRYKVVHLFNTIHRYTEWWKSLSEAATRDFLHPKAERQRDTLVIPYILKMSPSRGETRQSHYNLHIITRVWTHFSKICHNHDLTIFNPTGISNGHRCGWQQLDNNGNNLCHLVTWLFKLNQSHILLNISFNSLMIPALLL